MQYDFYSLSPDFLDIPSLICSLLVFYISNNARIIGVYYFKTGLVLSWLFVTVIIGISFTILWNSMGPYNFLECRISSFLCFYATKLLAGETWETLFFLHRIKGPQQIPNLINIFNNSDNKLTATALEALCHLVKLFSKTAINQRRNARVVAHVCCLFQCERLIALPTAHLGLDTFYGCV